MKALALLILLLSGCAGSDVLPRVGSALQSVKDGYLAADSALAAVSAVRDAVCAPELVRPETIDLCAEAASAVDKAEKTSEAAHDALNEAIKVYGEVNDAAR